MQPGDVVFARNDFTDTFWSVVSGAVEVEVDAQTKIRLGQGEFFGEMGLISGRRRVATVRAASSETLLLETPRKQMLKLIASVESVRRALDETFAQRVLQTSIFPKATPSFLMALTKRVTMRRFKKGEVLFAEGDVGDKLYVIRKGSVKISRRNRQGVDITQTYIPAGRYVGEMALLSAQELPRSATVTAAVACETLVIEKDDFRAILQHFPEERTRVERLAEERRIENATIDQRESSAALLDFMFGEGLSDAENVLLIDSDRCIACDNCEAACAATHGGYSRLDRKGGKSLATIQIPISCRHCENPLCMTDCPPDALSRMPNGEVIIRDSCIGCGNCVGNCPYGVIRVVHEKVSSGKSLLNWFGWGEVEEGPAKAAKCDQCHDLKGGPACVRACPTGAAMRVNSARLIEIAKSKGM
jgi:CRP-like cAMP-binding protein/Fe-S-cluster-containing hydrogenase component 2